VYAKKKLCLK